jgi:hypothetical protein
VPVPFAIPISSMHPPHTTPSRPSWSLPQEVHLPSRFMRSLHSLDRSLFAWACRRLLSRHLFLSLSGCLSTLARSLHSRRQNRCQLVRFSNHPPQYSQSNHESPLWFFSARWRLRHRVLRACALSPTRFSQALDRHVLLQYLASPLMGRPSPLTSPCPQSRHRLSICNPTNSQRPFNCCPNVRDNA